MNKFRKLIIFIFLLVPVLSYPEARVITITDCINIAMQNHPDLQISEENWKKAVAEYKVVKSQNSIQISGSIETREYNQDGDSDTTIAGQDTDIGLWIGIGAFYSLYDQRKIKQTKSARTALNLSKIDQIRVKQTVTLNVKRAYYAFLSARENLSLRKQLYENNKEKLELSRKLFKSGQRPILDVSKAEVTYAEAILEYERGKNKNRSARLGLHIAIGIKDKGTEIVPVEIQTLPELKYTYAELIKLAHLYNTDLQTIQVNKDLDKQRIDIERSERFPKIELSLLLGYENKALYQNDSFKGFIDEENWEIRIAPSLRIRFPIYTGGAISAKVDAAISNYNIDLYQERQTQINLENMILNDVKTIEELQKQLQMAELIIENSNKNLNLATKSYESGAVSLLDLQDAQMRVITSQIGYINAKYEYLLTIAQIATKIGLEENYLCRTK